MIIEVAHPNITKEFGVAFLKEADFMVRDIVSCWSETTSHYHDHRQLLLCILVKFLVSVLNIVRRIFPSRSMLIGFCHS